MLRIDNRRSSPRLNMTDSQPIGSQGIADVKIAIRLWVEVARRKGLFPITGKGGMRSMATKAISVREIPEDLWQAARIEAMKRGLSMRDFLVTLLIEATKPREIRKP